VLDLGDDRLAGADDLLFVRERALGVLAGEKVEIGFPDAGFGRGRAKNPGVGGIVADEPAAEILQVAHDCRSMSKLLANPPSLFRLIERLDRIEHAQQVIDILLSRHAEYIET
jgi:hypothetical protein